MASIHEQVDIERWKREFSLASLRQEAREFVLQLQTKEPGRYQAKASIERHIEIMSPEGERIAGPHDIAVVEQIREEAFAGIDTSKLQRVPTDIFVFGKGEPARPEVTKVGGVPYRPANKPWPTTRAGDPMSFVAQFCFTDSRDLVGKLPGDVLLIFASSEGMSEYLEDGDCFFEWTNWGLSDLITQDQIPETEYVVKPYFGAIHRSFDYLDARSYFSQYSGNYLLDIFEGTKIGGVPRWIQSPEDLPGRFLCALGSISVSWHLPFPYVNVPEPLESFDNDALMWNDVGSMYLFIDEAGKIHWAVQSY